jgi:polyisoprenoid-binding protein YceI
VLLQLLSSLVVVPWLVVASSFPPVRPPAPGSRAVGAMRAPPATASAEPATWNIDVTHSELTFEIRHFVERVKGTFKDWKGTIVGDLNDWPSATIDVAIKTASITTNNDRRDADLRSSNFFAADSFPLLTFRSTKIERTGDKARIYGNLTMRGVTKPIVLDGHFIAAMKMRGYDRVGFDASTTVNRLDWGVAWNRAVEGGGLMLGDDVKIEIVVAASNAPPQGPPPPPPPPPAQK